LIVDLFNHFQQNSGKDYQHPMMNNAYKNLILADRSVDSTLSIIEKTIEQFYFSKSELTRNHFSDALSRSHLPKNTRWKDWINRMGITVHDINSTKISIEKLSSKAINTIQ